MIYAMNLYDLVEGKEEMYREYMQRTAELMEGLDITPVAAGHNPRRSMSGEARGHFVIMKFGSMEDFEQMISRQDAESIGSLREESTENYIWTLYDEWDIGSWLFAE